MTRIICGEEICLGMSPSAVCELSRDVRSFEGKLSEYEPLGCLQSFLGCSVVRGTLSEYKSLGHLQLFPGHLVVRWMSLECEYFGRLGIGDSILKNSIWLDLGSKISPQPVCESKRVLPWLVWMMLMRFLVGEGSRLSTNPLAVLRFLVEQGMTFEYKSLGHPQIFSVEGCCLSTNPLAVPRYLVMIGSLF
jgi:hypothetical protein